MKKILTASFTALFAFAMCVPAFALAEGEDAADGADAASATEQETVREPVEPVPIADGDNGLPKPLENMEAEPVATEAQVEAPSATTSDEAADCYATFNYYEIVYYEEDRDLRLLGTYVVDGLKPGDVLNVWDYVFDIPGYFFFDGTAPSLTISADNSKNVIDLKYGKLMNSELTVNYYVMTGANLAGDDWADTLVPTTRFHKVGTQTLVNQRFDMEVNGDDFEQPVDGLYVVDTFPQSLRLTENPEDNVLNVLYVPTAANLPDDEEIFEVPEAPAAPGPSEGAAPDQTPARPGDVVVPTPIMPTESTLGSFTAPYDPTAMEGVAFADGHLETGEVGEPITFTEEMVANPVSQQTAERYAKAFEQGTPLLSPLPATTDALNIQLGGALLLVLLAYLAICIYAFERGRQGK